VGATLRCERSGDSSTVRIAGVRAHKGRLLLQLEGVGVVEAARGYSGALLYADRRLVPLDRGEYFDQDLVGCTVCGTGGAEYGPVTRIEHYPASDMLIVGEKMIPMVAAIVLEIDLARGRITIDPPAGLLD
jgi:16S rRNA processing protein RimM